ncbi:hybrid sensor histidine kinase/response regulator [Amaricoccus solimangrovi]|uniref:histidine kinase n=1 Tax=Amaricoccus solimangrovi TaxID=2589815 RepID=A0A501WUS8_9RHOB|nr:PAS-domain containing protein [Amaricoccus solimangrovi]TPE52150.1 response regulator [Amaricoccus solimangrovi]
MKPLLLDPADDLATENRKLRRIADVLMERIEREIAEGGGAGYTQFQLAAALEEQVRARTKDLDDTMKMLSIANARLNVARQEAEQARNDLYDAIEAVQEGFALFGQDDALILCNSRFSAQLPDVAPRLGPGLKFVDYVRMVSRSEHLQVEDDESREEWARQRLKDHRSPRIVFLVGLINDRWLQVSAYRTPSDGTAVLQTDVTDMVRREREERDRLLDDQARLLRATLDHITQGVAIFDAQRRLAGCNQRLRRLASLPLQFTQAGADFRGLLDYMSAGARFLPAAQLEALGAWVERDERGGPLSLELRRSDGAVLDVFCQEMPDRGFVISFTDMTAEREAVAAMHHANETLEQRVAARTRELEAARDEAERANASKSRFVASSSHDLLQPLNAAKLFVSSLTHTELDAEQRGIADRIRSAFESVETILGALLDISNLDIGKASTEVTVMPVAPLLRSIDQEFQGLARERGLELRVIPCSLWVESDPAYLRRILQNLVVNALRYTKQGKVVVGAVRRGDRLRFLICDTGPGIPPDRRAEIFDEFVRLEHSPGTPQGMGLGLAIVERACALLDHPLSLDSEVGRGTRFGVSVPVAEPATAAEEDEERGNHRGPLLDDLIAMVIENDDAVRAGMIALLEDWGTSPLEARDIAGAEALVDDLGTAPDVIIADYLLDDGETGLAAIQRLRAAHGPIPAVIVSADRGTELRAAAAREDITLLHKPLELHRLQAVLQWVKTSISRERA